MLPRNGHPGTGAVEQHLLAFRSCPGTTRDGIFNRGTNPYIDRGAPPVRADSGNGKRLMGKRDFFGWLALALLCVGAGLAYYYYGVAPRTLRVAAPPSGTQTTQFLQAMASALRKEGARVRLTVIPFDSNEAIAAAFEAQKADLAAVRADRALPSSAVGVAELGRFTALVLVRPGAGIEKFADLRGRLLAELTPSKTGAGVFRELAQLSHFSRGEFQPQEIGSLSAIGPAISAGNLDAVLASVPRGSTAFLDEMHAVERAFGAPAIFMPINEAAALTKTNSVFKAEDIAVGELASIPLTPPVALPTVTFPLLLVAHRDESPAIIQDLTAQMFDVRSSLMAQYPGAARLAALDTTRGGAIPVHGGAATYYDASETSFLGRYSDVLWLLLFGFSTIASAVVWLMRRLFPSERELLRTEHTELLEIMRTVRESDDAESLDRAESRIDEILASIARLAFEGKLDSSQKSAFDITMARLEKTIEAKRQSIEHR